MSTERAEHSETLILPSVHSVDSVLEIYKRKRTKKKRKNGGGGEYTPYNPPNTNTITTTIFFDLLIFNTTTFMDFDSIWQVLLANGTSPRRQDEAATAWARYTPQQQQQIHDIIMERIKQRKFVAFIPTQAFIEASRLITDNAPVNHFGKPLSRSLTYYTAIYNGTKGLYTAADVERYHMSNPQKFEI